MSSRTHTFLQILLASLALTAGTAGAAGAATVVNGSFEAGLTGWLMMNDPPPPNESGSWLTSSADFPAPPPDGEWAAITEQGGPGTHILYQDLALEPFSRQLLSMTVYYVSENPPVTPEPNTLSAFVAVNQQYRIDVVRPSAPIDTLNPADVLATVFATKTGDPQAMGPRVFSADLSAFAGQTVRLRLAEVDNQGYLNAAVDGVSIATTLLPPPPPSNAFRFGKPILKKRTGTAKLPVTVPGAGTLKIVDVKKQGKRIKGKILQTSAAGTLNLPVTPTKPGRKALRNRGKLKLKVAVTFTPIGGLAAAQTRKLTLKLTPRK